MKYALLLLVIPLLSGTNCGKKKNKTAEGDNNEAAFPACVQQLIDEAGKTSPPTTPVKVDEYIYKGRKAYLFTAPCCDFYNIAYDDSCRRICAPSGGFTGGGDGLCRDFDSTAKLVKTIWSNPVK
ncbi:MAG: hypothetical protein FJY20_12355 [Bacteroidetes bacterium]|nr:hypothetical protein [Bacteroidota bacterium]